MTKKKLPYGKGNGVMKRPTRTTLTIPAVAVFAAMIAAFAGLWQYDRDLSVVERWKFGATTVTLSRDGTLRVSGNGAMADCPSPYDDDTNSAPWYGFADSITRLVIEEGVTHIGAFAFYRMKRLTSVTIPKSVTSIGDLAFYRCNNLISVKVPASLHFIADYMPRSASVVVIPRYTRRTTAFIFAGTGLAVAALFFLLYKKTRLLHRLYNFYIKKTIRRSTSNIIVTICSAVVIAALIIGLWGHGGDARNWDCGPEDNSLPAEPLPAKGRIMKSWDCGKVMYKPHDDPERKGKTIYSGVKCELDENRTLWVSGNGLMKNYAPPEGYRWRLSHTPRPWVADDQIQKPDLSDLFDRKPPRYPKQCSVATVVIEDGVTSIGARAFADCAGLTSVHIANSVTEIGNYAFERCSSLTSVRIPNSVTRIGDNSFAETGLTSVTIPNSVTDIQHQAFFGSNSLTSVTIGYGVLRIGHNAFYNFNIFPSIDVNECNPNYASIDGILYNKYKTELIHFPGNKRGVFIIPDGVTSIKNNAFSVCSGLTSITIPSSVTSIGAYVFDGCAGLTAIISKNPTPPEFRDALTFGDVPEDICIHVPAGSIDAYRAADVWEKFNCVKELVK